MTITRNNTVVHGGASIDALNMYFMLFIFLLEVAFAVFPKFIGQLTTIIAKLFVAISDDELNARAEIKDLKEKQSGLSMTDDFAQYAKLQRRVDKLMNEIKEAAGQRKQRMAYLRMGVTVAIYVIHAVIMISLMIWMRNEPLMTVPSAWVYPFGKLVAFPTGIPGAVGLGCWVFLSNSVIRRIRTIAKI